MRLVIHLPHSLSNGLLNCRTGRPGACLIMFASLGDHNIHAKSDLAMLESPQHARRQGRSNAIETGTPQGSCSPIAQSIDSLVFAKFELKLCVLDFFNEKSDILQSSCHALICCEEITLRTRHSSSSAPNPAFDCPFSITHTQTYRGSRRWKFQRRHQ